MKKLRQRNGTEDALGKADGLFRSLLQHDVAILDADGTLRYVSPAVEAMLGYAPEEVTGTEVFDYVHPDDLERMLGALAETLAASDALTLVEVRHVTLTARGGTSRWCATTAWTTRRWEAW